MTPLPDMKPGPAKHICESEIRRMMNELETRMNLRVAGLKKSGMLTDKMLVVHAAWLEEIVDVMRENGIE